jgi:poly(A) polymerase
VLGGVPLIDTLVAMVEREVALSLVPDPLRRLAALAVLVAEDAERLWERLRLTNVEHVRLASMSKAWWQVSPANGERAARALLYRLQAERFLDRVLMAWAHTPDASANAEWIGLAQLPQRWTVPVFPLKAADFMMRGIPQGPGLGAAMRAAEADWVAADFPANADTISRIADAAVRQVHPD